MSTLGWIVIITTVAGVGGTGLGGLVGAILRRDSSKVVSLLLSFAGGVMLSVVAFDLMPGAVMPEGSTEPVALWIVIAGVILGYSIIYVLNYFIDKSTNNEIKHIDKTHPKTADDLDELIHADHLKEHRELAQSSKTEAKYCQLFIAGVVMASAIALHNLPEGMVIGASYAGNSGVLLGGSGFIIALVIGLHNIPEGMAVSVPLITGGMSKARAIMVTALSGAPTIIGAIIGYTLGLISPIWLALSLSFASGAMLYVVFGELLPEAILMFRSKAPAFFTLLGVLVGFVMVHV
ncbi:MAG: ZIP family metal transporter [Sphaerochaetaceae bacterium]|jgi:ZIP family zinc transporter|nr:ZIP family metal transporter [Sphaerochaetaceae bacterium]